MQGGESLQNLIDNLNESARYDLLDKLIQSVPVTFEKVQK